MRDPADISEAKPPPKTALERLQDAGELTLVRSAWCEPEPGKPGEWCQVLTATQGLLLLSEGLAVYRDRRLRPA